jgi:hypothetical protein
MKDYNTISERENIGWSIKRWPSTNIPLYYEDELSEEDSLIYRRIYTRESIADISELDFEKS